MVSTTVQEGSLTTVREHLHIAPYWLFVVVWTQRTYVTAHIVLVSSSLNLSHIAWCSYPFYTRSDSIIILVKKTVNCSAPPHPNPRPTPTAAFIHDIHQVLMCSQLFVLSSPQLSVSLTHILAVPGLICCLLSISVGHVVNYTYTHHSESGQSFSVTLCSYSGLEM